MPGIRSVNLRVSIKGGSIVESEEKSGLAHFMEHMLVQGIPSFPTAQALSEYIEGLAGSYNAYTTQYSVSFTITVPATHLEDAIRILSEIVSSPLFPEESIEKERRAVLNEIQQDMDSRWYKAGQFFKKTRFIDGSLLRGSVAGKPDTVAKLTRDDFVAYWKKYFIPKNMSLLISGNVEKDTTQDLLEKYFANFTSDKEFEGYPKLSAKDLAGRKVAIMKDEGFQTNYIDLTFPSISLLDDAKLKSTQNLALIILGQLRTSRLFQMLRYDKGLVYNVSATDYYLPGLGYINISSEVNEKYLEEVLELITKELISYRATGPLQTELDFTKNYLSNKWQMSFDHPAAISDWLHRELFWEKKIRMPEEYIKMLDEISIKDVVEVMQNHWDMNKLQLSLLGPLEETKSNFTKYESIIKHLK